MKQQNISALLAALLLAIALLAIILLITTPSGIRTFAATMFLRKTEGTVAVSDGQGKDVAPEENLGLYSGYTVGTEAESFAWIDLDTAKRMKLDSWSKVIITKSSQNLSLNVTDGRIFFHMAEPLADGETLEIRTFHLQLSIRSTCFWVGQDKVGLLEGTASVTLGKKTVTISAGESVYLSSENNLMVGKVSRDFVPDFVAREILSDDALQQTVRDTIGLTFPTSYEGMLRALEQEKPDDRIVYSGIIDFEQDDSPELLVLFIKEGDEGPSLGVGIYRDGPEWVRRLTYFFERPDGIEEIRCSLVESDGRFLLRNCIKRNDGYYVQYRADYIGSLAEQDGVYGDWGTVDSFLQIGGDYFDPNQEHMFALPHYGGRFVASGSFAHDLKEVDTRGKYTFVRELYFWCTDS